MDGMQMRVAPAPTTAPARLPRGYLYIANHPGDRFNPFEPDPVGALREILTWVQQPRRSESDAKGCGTVTYDAARYNDLTAMCREALRRADAKAGERVA